MAVQHGCSAGRSIEGILSSFLTKVCWLREGFYEPLATTSFLKAMSSGGGEDPPPTAMAEAHKDKYLHRNTETKSINSGEIQINTDSSSKLN